ncbi:MAG: FixH family protein [Blastocatellia bacterium]
MTASLSNATGALKTGPNEFTVQFLDPQSKPVAVSGVSLKFFMPAMGEMAPMQSGAQLTSTGQAGTFNARAEVQMAGNWRVTIDFQGRGGQGQMRFNVNASQ